MNPKSRAHRTLRLLKSYRSVGDCAELTGQLPALPPNDSWLGIYFNRTASIENAVAFSTEQLLVHVGNRWNSLRYEEILDTRIQQEKTSASEILVRTQAGDVIVPVTGGAGTTRDVFEVLRFLNRVREDLRKASPALRI
jgi:hypothetical protein